MSDIIDFVFLLEDVLKPLRVEHKNVQKNFVSILGTHSRH